MTTSYATEPQRPGLNIDGAEFLSFRATGRDRSGATVGMLVDASGAPQHLLIAPDGSWTLARVLPRGQKPVLIYESAANVLRGGAPTSDGGIVFQGDSYRIEACFDSGSCTARVRPRP
jgi:hypothetical protein